MRYGEIISLLYFNPWALGTAAYGLPAVGLSHRPVYLTSNGPSGKTSLLRLLLARTKVRHNRGVAALSNPQQDDDDVAAGGAIATAGDAPSLSNSRNGRSSTAMSSHPVMMLATGPIAAPVDPKFLPHLSTHWIAMPRQMTAAELQISVSGKLDRQSPTLFAAHPRPIPAAPPTASTLSINASSVDMLSAKIKRVAGNGGGAAAASGLDNGPRVASLETLHRTGATMQTKPLAPPSANRLLVVIDDVSLHVPESFGAHPPLELLRFWLEHGGFYDETKLSFNTAAETMWLLSGSAAGGVAVRHALPDRLIRHVHLLCMPSSSSETTMHIFRTLMSGYLTCDQTALALHAPMAAHGASSFSADLRKSGDAAVAATLSLLSATSQDVRPSPARLQYALDPLRDVAHVIDGVCQINPAHCDDPTTFGRLWLHEALRVFHDRMGSVRHQLTVSHAAVDCVSRFFHLSIQHDAVMAMAEPENTAAQGTAPTPRAAAATASRDRVNAGPVLFGRFTNHGGLAALTSGAQPYEQLFDADAVTRGMYTSMAEHDMMHPSDKPMSDLVSVYVCVFVCVCLFVWHALTSQLIFNRTILSFPSPFAPFPSEGAFRRGSAARCAPRAHSHHSARPCRPCRLDGGRPLVLSAPCSVALWSSRRCHRIRQQHGRVSPRWCCSRCCNSSCGSVQPKGICGCRFNTCCAWCSCCGRTAHAPPRRGIGPQAH